MMLSLRRHSDVDKDEVITRIDSLARIYDANHSQNKIKSNDGSDTLRYGFLGSSPVFVIRRSGWKRYVVFHAEPDKKKLEEYLGDRYSKGAELALLNHGWSPRQSKVVSYSTIFLALFLGGYDMSIWQQFNNLDQLASSLINEVRKLMNVEARELLRNISNSKISKKIWDNITIGTGKTHFYSAVKPFCLYKKPYVRIQECDSDKHRKRSSVYYEKRSTIANESIQHNMTRVKAEERVSGHGYGGESKDILSYTKVKKEPTTSEDYQMRKQRNTTSMQNPFIQLESKQVKQECQFSDHDDEFKSSHTTSHFYLSMSPKHFKMEELQDDECNTQWNCMSHVDFHY